MFWSWRKDLKHVLFPILIFLCLTLYTVPKFAPTQEEVFGRQYREQVICSTTDGMGQVAEKYCLQTDDKSSFERTRSFGPFALRSSPIRPELSLQIGSFTFPVLEQSFQGAAYAGLIRIGLTFFGHNVYGLRIPLVLLGVFILILSYLLFSRIFGRMAGMFITLLVATFNYIFFRATVVYIQTAYVFALLGISFLIFRFSGRRNFFHAGLAGLLAGIAIYANFLHIAGIAALCLAAFVFQRNRFLFLMKPIWLAFLCFLIPLIPYFVQNVFFQSTASSVLGDQIQEFIQNPLIYFDLVWQRMKQLHLMLQGSRNMVHAVGILTARGPVTTLGYPLLFYIGLLILFTGWGAKDQEQVNWSRYFALLAALVPFTSVSNKATPLHMFCLMDPLVPIVIGLAAWQAGQGLYRLFLPRKGIFTARIAFALPLCWACFASLWLTGSMISAYPYLRETLLPMESVKSLADFLEREEIHDAVDVHIEDLRYPIEFLTHNRIRLKHHFTFKGPRGWDRAEAEAEWDRVLALNRGRHFVVKSCVFAGVPSDEQLLREAATRNGIGLHPIKKFLNPAGEPVFWLFKIE